MTVTRPRSSATSCRCSAAVAAAGVPRPVPLLRLPSRKSRAVAGGAAAAAPPPRAVRSWTTIFRSEGLLRRRSLIVIPHQRVVIHATDARDRLLHVVPGEERAPAALYPH